MNQLTARLFEMHILLANFRSRGQHQIYLFLISFENFDMSWPNKVVIIIYMTDLCIRGFGIKVQNLTQLYKYSLTTQLLKLKSRHILILPKANRICLLPLQLMQHFVSNCKSWGPVNTFCIFLVYYYHWRKFEMHYYALDSQQIQFLSRYN